MDESYMKKATEACNCAGSNSKLELSVSDCQLEEKDIGLFCKKSTDSNCRDAVAEMANVYQNQNSYKKEYCYENDRTYRGIQEVAAICKRK